MGIIPSAKRVEVITIEIQFGPYTQIFKFQKKMTRFLYVELKIGMYGRHIVIVKTF